MKIYFMGICGTAMGNIAVMLKSLGNDISGSDTNVYEPMKSVLSNAGISIYDGWSVERLCTINPDLVVVGNVISRMNPEMEFLLDTRTYDFVSLPELIGTKIIKNRKSLVVSGTHGKTTTTAIASYLLLRNNKNPGWLIGGVPKDLKEGSIYGDDKAPFVIEGDEYDSAFFDKRSKFIHYRPHVLLINNIEFDHADIFRDLDDVKRTFTHVRRIVSPSGVIIENGDDENIDSLENTPWTKRIKVGESDRCDLRISNFVQSGDSSSFKIKHGVREKCIEWGLSGLYNARNATMAIAGVSSIMKFNEILDVDVSSLLNFQGVSRRQEIILKTDTIVAIEDFGHHPTAIKYTIELLREKFRGYKVYACFEPRSNSAKTCIFEKDFGESLSLSDKVFIGAVHGLEKIKPEFRMSTSRMASVYGDKFISFETNESLYNRLCSEVERKGIEEKIVCVFFSNGSFDGIHKNFAKRFEGKK